MHAPTGDISYNTILFPWGTRAGIWSVNNTKSLVAFNAQVLKFLSNLQFGMIMYMKNVIMRSEYWTLLHPTIELRTVLQCHNATIIHFVHYFWQADTQNCYLERRFCVAHSKTFTVFRQQTLMNISQNEGNISGSPLVQPVTPFVQAIILQQYPAEEQLQKPFW